MNGRLMVYGASGVAGRLITRQLGLQYPDLIVAGRTESKLAEFRFERRVFQAGQAIEKLEGVGALLNCAGPFPDTALPLARACIAKGVDYVDICGEASDLESMLRLDKEAKEAKVMLLPAAGCSVILSEGAGAMAKQRVGGNANKLMVAVEHNGVVTKGMMETRIRSMKGNGYMRVEGHLKPAKARDHRWDITFGGHFISLETNPWRADVITSYLSLGIPDIEGFTIYSNDMKGIIKVAGSLDSPAVKMMVRKLIDRKPAIVSATELQAGSTKIWVEVSDGGALARRVYLETPDPYLVTQKLASAVMSAIARGFRKPGFQTPYTLFGLDLFNQAEGIKITEY